MPSLLRLDTSSSAERSVTKALTERFATAWSAKGVDYGVVARDLHADPLPHLESSELHYPAAIRLGDPLPQSAQDLQDAQVEQLLATDALLIGAPMYNYSMPSTLKTWIDRIHLPGITTGLPTLPLAGKPAVIVSAAGAVYDAGTPSEHWDHAVPPLRIVLGDALGMDVHVVTVRLTLAERLPDLAPQAERARQELAAAEAAIDELVAKL